MPGPGTGHGPRGFLCIMHIIFDKVCAKYTVLKDAFPGL